MHLGDWFGERAARLISFFQPEDVKGNLWPCQGMSAWFEYLTDRSGALEERRQHAQARALTADVKEDEINLEQLLEIRLAIEKLVWKEAADYKLLRVCF